MTTLSLNNIPVVQPLVWNAQSFCKLRQRNSLAVVLAKHRQSSISHLRSVIRPSAIFWRVVAVVVYAIKRHSIRPWPHVGKKVLKLGPAIADRYTSAAIVLKLFAFWIVAALAHGYPRSKLRAICLSVLKPCRILFIEASTRLLAAVINVVTKGTNFFPAVAQKQPSGLMIAGEVFNPLDGNKPSKPHPGHVNCFHVEHYKPNMAIQLIVLPGLTKRRQAEFKTCMGDAP